MIIHSESVQGGRQYQEDRYINGVLKNNSNIMCVFDGHGGDYISEFCSKNIISFINKSLDANIHDINQLLRVTFKDLDNVIALLKKPYTGTTSLCLLQHGHKCYFANIGDSMGMMVNKNGFPIMMSQEHKVDFEQVKLKQKGAFITREHGMARVNGTLNLSRALGDFYLKKFITSTPFIKTCNIKDTEYIILASDGIWDVLTMQDIVNIFKEKKTIEIPLVLKEIIKIAIEKGSMDNITITYIKF